MSNASPSPVSSSPRFDSLSLSPALPPYSRMQRSPSPDARLPPVSLPPPPSLSLSISQPPPGPPRIGVQSCVRRVHDRLSGLDVDAVHITHVGYELYRAEREATRRERRAHAKADCG